MALGDGSESSVTNILAPDGRIVARRIRLYELTVVLPDQRELVMEVDKSVFRAGSHASNDLVLDDDSVSRIHFEICGDDLGFKLRDLGSTNGTYVDGYRAVELYLKPRSRISAGLTQIQFRVLDKHAEQPLSLEQQFGPLVGKSAAMRELFGVLERVAPTDYTVLIHGQSGSGKEVIAEAIHGASARRAAPFVVFDCAAVSGNLIESELFGHEKGAFTGADARRVGCLEAAEGGTLFLDEIGELPLDIQPKLLRAVEKREVRPVGSNKPVKVDVRLIAASHRDLGEEVNRGAFREDLYYRLAVVRLKVPPLRERTEDIPLLVEHMLKKILRDDPGRVRAVMDNISEENWRRLARHPWRGNVRELRNTVERSLALHSGSDPVAIDPDSGSRPSPAVRSAPPPVAEGGPKLEFAIDFDRPLSEQKNELVAQLEKNYIQQILERTGGNISRAASAAGLDRAYFKRLMSKYFD